MIYYKILNIVPCTTQCFVFNRMVCVFEYGKMSMVYCLIDEQTHSLSSVFHMPSLQIPSPISLNVSRLSFHTCSYNHAATGCLSLWTVSLGGWGPGVTWSLLYRGPSMQ